MTNSLYAALELGGTKTICTIGSKIGEIRDQLRIPTTSPDTTLLAISRFLERYKPFESIGIGAFGPVNVDPQSEQYGVIEATPKYGWKGVSLVRFFREKFSCPVHLNTDVNAAALAEYKLGEGVGLRNFIYITVGTGIGAGVVIDGKITHGLSHPEIGHIALPRVQGDEHFESSCAYHVNCAEGLASGTAILKRWGAPLNTWDKNHIAWNMEAEYLAELSHSLIVTMSPQKIIFGGGVSSEFLLEKVRNKLHQKLNGYVAKLKDRDRLNKYLVLPKLRDQAGPYGTFLLAMGDNKTHEIEKDYLSGSNVISHSFAG